MLPVNLSKNCELQAGDYAYNDRWGTRLTCHVDLLSLFVGTRNVLEEALQTQGVRLEERGEAQF